jgi:glycosyltransferase involved in cell wall biosynthesis
MISLISILIPAYCKPEVLDKCLRSIGLQTYPHARLEVIVVDDCPPYPLDSVMDRFCSEFDDFNKTVFHKNKINLGRAASRNAALRYATGDVIFFLDVDNLLDPDCCQQLATYFNGCSGKLAVRCDIRSNSFGLRASSYIRFFNSRYLGQRTKSELMGIDLNDLPSKYFATDAIAVTSDAITITGGFDEVFSDYGCEDEDFGIRIIGSGFRFKFGFGCNVVDSDLPTVRRACDRMVVYAAKSVPRLLVKHPEYAINSLFSIIECPASSLGFRKKILRKMVLMFSCRIIAEYLLRFLEWGDNKGFDLPSVLYKYVLTSFYVSGFKSRSNF